jgi:hypothetical protein
LKLKIQKIALLGIFKVIACFKWKSLKVRKHFFLKLQTSVSALFFLSFISSLSVAGPIHGLNIAMYSHFYENLTLINSYPYLSRSGVFIRVDTNTFTMHFQQDGGFKSRLAVEREFKFNLPQPYSNCLINDKATAYNKGDSSLFDLILNSAYQYTQTCFLQCVQREIINKCNCTDASVLSLFSNVTQFLHETQIECMSHLYATRLCTNEFVQ